MAFVIGCLHRLTREAQKNPITQAENLFLRAQRKRALRLEGQISYEEDCTVLVLSRRFRCASRDNRLAIIVAPCQNPTAFTTSGVNTNR